MNQTNSVLPKWNIPIDSPFLGKTELVRTDGQSFWSFLSSHSIPFDKSDFPFLSTHTLPRVKKTFDFGAFINLSGKGEAYAELYKGLGTAWNYVGPVLDCELPHGFNDHTDRHTLWVTQTAVEILQRAGRAWNTNGGRYDARTETLLTLIGMTHDLGNFVDRSQHSMYSAWLLSRLFYNTEPHAAEWNAVLFSILFHEEPMLRDMAVNLSDGLPLQWALIAADKMHVGRSRIGDRSYESGIANNALADDVHILLNTLIARSAWILARRSFVWHLDFSLDQLEEKVKSFTNGNGRIWVPDDFYKQYKQKGTPFREIFAELFATVYEARIRMAAMCIFLLFPHVAKFQVFLTDSDMTGSGDKGELMICEVVR